MHRYKLNVLWKKTISNPCMVRHTLIIIVKFFWYYSIELKNGNNGLRYVVSFRHSCLPVIAGGRVVLHFIDPKQLLRVLLLMVLSFKVIFNQWLEEFQSYHINCVKYRDFVTFVFFTFIFIATFYNN